MLGQATEGWSFSTKPGAPLKFTANPWIEDAWPLSPAMLVQEHLVPATIIYDRAITPDDVIGVSHDI